MMKSITDNIKPLLALTVIWLSFIYFFVCLVLDKNPNAQILIGIVGFCGSVLGYYYGYSQGSAKKDEAIQNQLENSTK